jgi:hypothetical protein
MPTLLKRRAARPAHPRLSIGVHVVVGKAEMMAASWTMTLGDQCLQADAESPPTRPAAGAVEVDLAGSSPDKSEDGSPIGRPL